MGICERGLDIVTYLLTIMHKKVNITMKINSGG